MTIRWRSAAGLLFSSLLLLLTGGPTLVAEDDAYRYNAYEQRLRQQQGYGGYGARQRSSTRYETYQRQPYGYEGRGQRLYYDDPRAGGRQFYDPRVARPQPPPAYQPGFPFFSAPREVAPPPVYLEPRQARRRYEPPPRRVRRPVPAAPKVEQPDEPEVEPSTHIVFFGDSLADLVAQGLDTNLEDAEDIGIVRKTRGDSGLVRNDFHDWPKSIQDTLNGGQKITIAVMMLGANDRQAIREGDISHDPLSDRWKEIYRQRIDDVVKVFTERRIPLVWIGAPPVRNDKLSADLMTMNELYKERVQRAGAVYVDVWPGFVDDQNRYAATGPDLDGQVARLRTADGVHFTKAGARKAAHFADVELKRLIEAKGGSAVAAVPPPSSPAAPPVGKAVDVDRLINASLPALPEPQGLPALPSKPIAGPVLPLTRPEVSPGGALVTGRPRLEGDAYLVERALRSGVAPPTKPGRADDFKWPRS